MSPFPVTYTDHRAWDPSDSRPYGEIVVYGPKGYERIWALLDTGADDLQIEDSFAKKIGFDLSVDGYQVPAQTAGGSSINLTCIPGVKVEIEGKIVTVDCLFGSNSTPLLGRNTILAAMDIGFDVNGWLFKI